MFFYIYLCLFVFILSFSYTKCKNPYLALDIKILIFLFLFIPAALRFGIGTDYVNYVHIFNTFKNTNEIQQEFGWKLINQFVLLNNLPVHFIFVIASFLTYFALFWTDKKSFWIVFFIYFLYLYTTSYNAVRNAISITFFWASYTCLLKGKKIKGFLLILLGSLFHSSALVYIPVYLLMCFLRLSKKKTLIIAVIGYILLARLRLAEHIMDSTFLQGLRYAAYISRKEYNTASSIGSGFGILLRQFFLFLLYALCDESKSDKKEFNAVSVLFLFLLFSDILMVQIVIFSRLLTIFYVAYMACFRHIFIYKSKNAYIEVMKWGCLAYSIVFVFLWGLATNQNEVIPYTSIFD